MLAVMRYLCPYRFVSGDLYQRGLLESLQSHHPAMVAIASPAHSRVRCRGVFRLKLRRSKFAPPMSALGQKQTSRCAETMSALPPKADIGTGPYHLPRSKSGSFVTLESRRAPAVP